MGRRARLVGCGLWTYVSDAQNRLAELVPNPCALVTMGKPYHPRMQIDRYGTCSDFVSRCGALPEEKERCCRNFGKGFPAGWRQRGFVIRRK